MPNIFLSHRKPDVAEAERLDVELKTAGHHVWFDEWEINIGDSIVERINQGLQDSVYLILCYSSSGYRVYVPEQSGSYTKYPIHKWA